MPGAYCDPCRCYRNEVCAVQDNVHMRYVHMRYSSCCSCYCCRCCRCCRCSRRRRRRRAGCRRCHCCCSCRCCCCRAAAAAAAAAAAVAISCLCYAACHAACHAVCPGAWRTRFVWFMRRTHVVRAQGKGRVLLAGSLGPIALVLTCTAESMMTNLMRESSS